MSRAEDIYGKRDINALFGDSPVTPTPWPAAGRRKDRLHYDKDRVTKALSSPETQTVASFDPRHLRSTQPSVTRAGVSHYLSGETTPYADKDNAGNKRPVVYSRDDGQNIILSGHHRAAKALLQGKQFDAVQVSGPMGPKRA